MRNQSQPCCASNLRSIFISKSLEQTPMTTELLFTQLFRISIPTTWCKTRNVRFKNHNLNQKVGSCEKKDRKTEEGLGGNYYETQNLLERIIASLFLIAIMRAIMV
mmetsp:Transcript_68816/g.111684  ORF Transcript_68816/g.111684 Transcript_68816/m.111684 type:complete len:106 (-) Transcript_68816:136-453(-)